MSGENELEWYTARFRGMYDNRSVVPGPDFVRFAENYFLSGGSYRPRPGTVQIGAQIEAAQKIQALASYQERATGNRHRIAFCNGKMYEYTYGAPGSFVEVVLAGGAALDPDADLDWCVFNDRLVVTDGVNQPWSWDGTTFTVITAAPIARSCTVYYLKLFLGDLPAEPATFKWSQEANELLGYEGPHPDGGTYNNTWTFGATDSGRILKLVGLNENLLVFKQDSIASIRGAVEGDFQTAATREAVSDSYGLVSARSVVVRVGDVYFLAPSGPKVIRGGGTHPMDVALGRIAETWNELRRDIWDRTVGAYDPVREHVIWLAPRHSGTLDWGICYSPERDAASDQPDQGFSYFSGWMMDVMGVWEDDDGNDEIVLGDGDGNVFVYGRERVWDDGGVAVYRRLDSHSVGREAGSYKNFDRLDFLFRVGTDATVTVTPRAETGEVGPPKAVSLSGGEPPLWGVALWGQAVWQGEHLVPYTRGLNLEAIACGWRIEQRQLASAVEVIAARVQASVIDDFPAAKSA